jgi:hypothetical protein
MKRLDIKAILSDPVKRRELMIRSIIAIQAREGIETTWDQAAAAYDKAMKDALIKAIVNSRLGV